MSLGISNCEILGGPFLFLLLFFFLTAVIDLLRTGLACG